MDLITPNGKEVELYYDGFGVKVRFVGGGELPDSLKGSWTNKTHARNSVLSYLDSMKKKSKDQECHKKVINK